MPRIIAAVFAMVFAKNKGADQLAHPRSLISAFVVHLLESIISQCSR